jgi:hypothetical protein
MLNRTLPSQTMASLRGAQRSVLRPISRSPTMRVNAFWGKPTTVNKETVIAEVSTQFQRWNDALQTRDPKKVAAL